MPGVVKLQSKDALIYIKYIRGFFDTEHNPMICWSGGGYQFKRVTRETIAGRKVYTATIFNGTDNLYTAWWYDNGVKHTTEQFEWRWDLVRGGKPYVLINIACSSREHLNNLIQTILQEQILGPFFLP
jgi:exosortase N